MCRVTHFNAFICLHWTNDTINKSDSLAFTLMSYMNNKLTIRTLLVTETLIFRLTELICIGIIITYVVLCKHNIMLLEL